MKYFLLTALLFTLSCSTAPKNNTFDADDFHKTVNQRTLSIEKHDGFQSLFNISATLLDKKVYDAIIEKEAHDKGLAKDELIRLTEKTAQNMSNETHFFVSYYSPIKSLNKLNKTGAWKVYLEQDGKRYKAVINNYPGNKFAIMSTFKNYTRWSKSYLIKFRVPTSVVENTPVRLIFSSASGKAVFNFPKQD